MEQEKKELTWREHLARAGGSFGAAALGFLPEEFRKNTQTGIKEILLAARGLLDEAIATLEEKPKKEAKKIEVK